MLITGKISKRKGNFSNVSQSWLSSEIIDIYAEFGVKQIHYFRAGGPRNLINRLEALLYDVITNIRVKRSEFILLLDMSTEGPASTKPLRESFGIISDRLGISKLQIMLISQNIAMRNEKGKGRKKPGCCSWAYANSFAWNAMYNKVCRASITPLNEISLDDSYKHYICLNNAHRPHRLVLYAYLHASKIIESTHFSFRTDVPVKAGRSTESRNRFNDSWRETRSQYPFAEEHICALLADKEDMDMVVDDVADVADTHDLIWRIPVKAYSESMVSIVTETMFCTGRTVSRYTEKTIKPILYGRPFILLGSPLSLDDLRGLGFQTFSGVIDESYDSIADPQLRMKAIFSEIARLSKVLTANPSSIYDLKEVCEFNRQHILSGELQKSLTRRHASTVQDSLARFRDIG